MPAWQKRQPAVQPRITSTTARSCTASSTGTTGRSTGWLVEKPVKTCRSAGPALRPGTHTPGTAASARRRGLDGRPRASPRRSRPGGPRPRRRRRRRRTARAATGWRPPGPPPRTMGSSPSALGGVQRHAGEVEHLEHVGVAELVREREAPEVAVRDRREGLERPQRHAGGAHERRPCPATGSRPARPRPAWRRSGDCRGSAARGWRSRSRTRPGRTARCGDAPRA